MVGTVADPIDFGGDEPKDEPKDVSHTPTEEAKPKKRKKRADAGKARARGAKTGRAKKGRTKPKAKAIEIKVKVDPGLAQILIDEAETTGMGISELIIHLVNKGLT